MALISKHQMAQAIPREGVFETVSHIHKNKWFIQKKRSQVNMLLHQSISRKTNVSPSFSLFSPPIWNYQPQNIRLKIFPFS